MVSQASSGDAHECRYRLHIITLNDDYHTIICTTSKHKLLGVALGELRSYGSELFGHNIDVAQNARRQHISSLLHAAQTLYCEENENAEHFKICGVGGFIAHYFHGFTAQCDCEMEFLSCMAWKDFKYAEEKFPKSINDALEAFVKHKIQSDTKLTFHDFLKDKVKNGIAHNIGYGKYSVRLVKHNFKGISMMLEDPAVYWGKRYDLNKTKMILSKVGKPKFDAKIYVHKGKNSFFKHSMYASLKELTMPTANQHK